MGCTCIQNINICVEYRKSWSLGTIDNREGGGIGNAHIMLY